MNMKLLFIINDNDQKVERIINKFKLPFNTVTHGIGTASKSMLDFFGLVETERCISMSIISENLEHDIFEKINNSMKIKEIGNGVAFTVPLSSSSKYISEAFIKKEGDKMKENCIQSKKYHLVMAIVANGYASKVMDAAKKHGANGGTLINGREIGGKNSFKFFNMTMEPEKDLILIVCCEQDKNKIMEAIIDKTGIKTEGKGMCISLPIDTAIGFSDDN